VDGSEYSAKHYSAKASASASTASTKASEASTSAAAAAASQTAAAASAASAASTYDQFDDRYLGTKSSDPSTDNDGNALVEGALYFSSTDNAMQVYDGSAWIAASSAGNVSITETHFTATAGQTTFNVSYTVDNLVVIMNGVVLQNGASKDYTATNGTSFTLASGAAAGDELHVIVFKSFTTADMVSKTNGGAYSGSVDFTGGLEINGTAVTATAAELNLLDGVTATTAELNYVDGVTSNIQTQIDNISTDVVSDTSPSLGGDLDVGSNALTSSGNIEFQASGQSTNTHSFIYNEAGGEMHLRNSSGGGGGFFDYGDTFGTRLLNNSTSGDLAIGQAAINTTGKIKFMGAGYTERMTIEADGSVDIDGKLTTGGATSSIGGTTFANVFKADGTHRAAAFVADQANSGASVWWADETQAPVCAIDGNNGGGMGLWVNNGSTWNNTVYLNNSNRVGIQNTNPQQTLDVTGVIRANNASDFVGTTSGATALEVFQPTANKDAALVFHVAGDFAAYLGLDGAKNDLFYGGWSEGANKYTVLHEKNTPNRVVQVKTQNFGPARQTIQSTSPVQLTGSGISFTPKYSNSKILISCNFQCTSSYVMSWGFYQGSSPLQSTSGYTNHNEANTWQTFYDGNNNHGIIEDHHMQGVFNAGSTSTRTYNVRATAGWSNGSYTMYINNRSSNDMAGLGNITVMEIAQ